MSFCFSYSVDHSGECRTRPGLQKCKCFCMFLVIIPLYYIMNVSTQLRLFILPTDSCQLTLDPNTAHRHLSLSGGNRKVTWGAEQPYPDHPERFDGWYQILCRESLTDRCYWEAEWGGDGAWIGALIGVTFKGIRRKGDSYGCGLGANDKSWILCCDPRSYSVQHNNEQTVIPIEPSGSRRVGVYLDWEAGVLSFYRVSSDGLILLHRVTSSFTEPLYPGFGIYPDSSVSLHMLGIGLCHIIPSTITPV
uniref:B30.2/SPRY domain-containing protein n=1 Tax=Paramormyrops kingsleyae TaxID=1676925 RepID=A0A3B3QXP4_9TELE